MYRLYDSQFSGNAWKVRLVMRELDMSFERATLNLAGGDAKSPAFGKINRFRRVPVLQLPDGTNLVESGSILLFLAEASSLLPDEPAQRAQTTSWLFFEQADLLKPLGLPRFYHLRGMAEHMHMKIAELQEAGYRALDILEGWIEPRTWLANDTLSIADFAVYPYVALAGEGGYEMDRYPGIGAWVKRIEERPSWQPLLEVPS